MKIFYGMMMKTFLTAFTLLVLVAHVYTEEHRNVTDILNTINKCITDDKSQVNKCFSDFFIEIKPGVAVGVKEMDIPPLDPIYIDRLDFPKDSSLIQGEAYFHNLTVHGIGKYNVKGVTVDIPKQAITLKVTFDAIDARGEYNFNGNFLVLPVKGEGVVEVRLEEVDGTVNMTIARDGAKIKLVKSDVIFEAKVIRFRLENLFGGEKEVGQAVNNLINDNSQEVIKELKPSLLVKLGDAYTASFKNLIKEVTPELFIVS